MLVDQRDRLLAAWDAGFLSDGQVSGWAERVLMSLEDPTQIPSWLLDLVERGPAGCREAAGFGWPGGLDYLSRFSLRAVALDLACDDDVFGFAAWAAGACMGEDLDEPVVRIGYHMDHLVHDCGRMDLAAAKLREELPAVLDACRARAQVLLDLSA